MRLPTLLVFSAVSVAASAQDWAPCAGYVTDVWNDYTKCTCQASMECYSADGFTFWRSRLDCSAITPGYKVRAVVNIPYWFDDHSDWLEAPGTVYSDVDTNSTPTNCYVDVTTT
ncbi:uncharacterized protein PV06_08341 [Exophiala oligosperma]|uniref:Extracellular membrane protein CFEM domain-containing protein n=2 Tax=Chaetothyriales TaxID=34395 RepID=A0A0D2AHX7_9EURO|nr:uncharacterized protein PV06_08341 [Exophiala oligosperma]KAJ9622158.1 hypothetical protein H2204_011665 [Knufia peltigerae]KIW39756.1 hypothetical protein PV06_08341 [Exophiala oligosperma]